MRRHEHDQRPTEPAPARPREAEAQPADALLALQRSAGNRAVSSLLARQPVPTAPKTGPETKKAATMTVGLGEEFVIPVDSMQWDGKTKVTVIFDTNPATSDLFGAYTDGKRFDTGFASTYSLMSRLTEVFISNMSFSGPGGPDEPLTVMTLEAKTVDHQPVK